MDDCRSSQSQSSILLMVQYLMSLDTGGLSPARVLYPGSPGRWNLTLRESHLMTFMHKRTGG